MSKESRLPGKIRAEEQAAAEEQAPEVSADTSEKRRRSINPQLLLFTLAIIFLIGLGWWLRREICRESLWVDELHTGWVIEGTFDELLQRASIGHQTPWYFLGLRVWSQLFGMTDWTLRLPSVLMSLFACGVLAVAGLQLTGRWVVGVAAASAMAIGRQGLFYGTEARGYAAVMLALTLLLWGTLYLMNQGLSGGSPRQIRLLLAGLFFTSMLATLVHVTALWSISFLALGSGAVIGFRIYQAKRSLRQPRGASKAFLQEQQRRLLALLLSLGGGGILALMLHAPYLVRTWGLRGQWEAFATARSFHEIGTMWPWLWCLIVPLVLATLSPPSSRRRSLDQRLWRMVAAVGLAVVLSTLVAWFVSRNGWVAIWHRRFLIGGLPMICLLGGFLWGRVERDWSAGIERMMRRRRGRRRGRERQAVEANPEPRSALGLAVGTVLLSASLVVVLDGSWKHLLDGQSAWVRRGEDWRGLVRYLEANQEPGEPVWLDAGLIESTWLLGSASETLAEIDAEYLVFPLRSLYRAESLRINSLTPVESITARDFPAGWLSRSQRLAEDVRNRRLDGSDSARGLWLVVRSNPQLADRAVNRWMHKWNEEESGKAKLRFERPPLSFGNLYLARIGIQ